MNFDSSSSSARAALARSSTAPPELKSSRLSHHTSVIPSQVSVILGRVLRICLPASSKTVWLCTYFLARIDFAKPRTSGPCCFSQYSWKSFSEMSARFLTMYTRLIMATSHCAEPFDYRLVKLLRRQDFGSDEGGGRDVGKITALTFLADLRAALAGMVAELDAQD